MSVEAASPPPPEASPSSGSGHQSKADYAAEAMERANARLFGLGLAATIFANLTFALIRAITEFTGGGYTPWHVNLAGAIALMGLGLYYRQDRERRRRTALNLGILICAICLVVPVRYDMMSSPWWLGILPLAAALIIGPRDGLVWAGICAVVAAVAHIFGERLVIPGAAGEDLVESTGSRVIMIGLLFWIAWRARRVSDQLTQELRQANAAKSAFLANVTHEMRTPLNGVLGMTNLALEEDLPRSARGYVRTAQDCAQGLLGIINDLLDAAQIDAARTRIDRAPFSLGEAVAGALRPVAETARAKGLRLTAWAEGTPDQRIGDSQRVRQIVTNLVGNAVKFTDSGRVSVRVSGQGEEVRIDVADTGPGIRPEDQARLFRPFEQVDSSSTRRFGGTGLGLAISRDLARLMGGDITIRSAPGRGSTFSVVLSLPLGDPAPTPDLAGHSLTLVTRDEAMRRWVGGALEGASVEVAHADDLSSALATNDSLIVIDGASIDETLALLDRLQRTDKRAVLLLPAGSVGPVISHPRVLRVIELPAFDGPLLRAIADAQKPVRLTPTRNEPVRLEAEDSGRVLVVDDNPVNRTLIVRLLERRGYEVRAAASGADALELLAADGADVVLTDLRMPGMDGVTLLTHIRKRFNGLPVLALTAHTDQETHERLMSAGMDACLPKPIAPPALYKAVRTAVQGNAASSAA